MRRELFDTVRENSINFLSILILIGAAQGLFLSFALVVIRKGNRRANLFLAALFVTLSIGLLDGFLNVAGHYSRYPHLIGIIWPANFLIGPFLYFYVGELCSPKQKIVSRKHFLHYLPALSYALLLLPFYFLGAESKMQILASSVAPLKVLSIFTLDAAALLAVIQKAGYYIASCLLISAYSSKIKERFSSIEKISLSWVRTLLVLFIILCFAFTFYSFFASPFGVYREAGYLFYLLSAVVAYIFAFKALIQPEVFSRLEAVHNTEPLQYDLKEASASAPPAVSSDILLSRDDTGHKAKYQRSSLSNEEAAVILQKLVKIMESEKLFLEPELTLPELSEKLSVLPCHLSQVINEELNKSFYDFVNEHRVRETQRLLSSSEYGHLSILGIALDAGFNSKSAFYSAFGKYTGMTPSEFRKRQAWTEPLLSKRA